MEGRARGHRADDRPGEVVARCDLVVRVLGEERVRVLKGPLELARAECGRVDADQVVVGGGVGGWDGKGGVEVEGLCGEVVDEGSSGGRGALVHRGGVV